MKREDLAWLLGLANDMRARHNDEKLDDLPISIPEDVGACIIANAFNYGCEVNPMDGLDEDNNLRIGHIRFWDINDAKTYCSVTGIDESKIKTSNDSLSSGQTCQVPLTEELNQVALDFDAGLYDEYNYYKWAETSDDPEAVAEREQWERINA